MKMKAIINKTGLWAKKHSPELLMGAGLLTMIGGGVLACRNSYKKLPEVKKKHEEKMTEIQAMAEEDGKLEVAKKEAGKEVFSYGFGLVKTYALPITMEAAGVTLVFASNNIMRKRVAGLTAAFTTVSTAYDTYRQRVIERYGEDVDRSILLNEKQETITVVDEKGKEKKETITVADPDIEGIGRYFTKSNPQWNDSESYVEYIFSIAQARLTDVYRSKKCGFITLNEIYAELDFEESPDGLVLGKVYDNSLPVEDEQNSVTIKYKKVKIPNEFGNYEDAYYVWFPGITEIYSQLQH